MFFKSFMKIISLQVIIKVSCNQKASYKSASTFQRNIVSVNVYAVSWEMHDRTDKRRKDINGRKKETFSSLI